MPAMIQNRVKPIWLEAMRIIRDDASGDAGQNALPTRGLIGLLILCGAFYGAVMGSYSAAGHPRMLQALVSALKAPLLPGITFAISLPSFFIFTALLGLRADFRLSLRLLVRSGVGQMVLLAALAPYTLFWNLSVTSYPLTIVFNAVIFGLASLGGGIILRRSYRTLIARDRRHAWLLRVWLITYAFVGIQAGWTMRPFIGVEGSPTTLFRPDSFTNAYLALLEICRRAVGL